MMNLLSKYAVALKVVSVIIIAGGIGAGEVILIQKNISSPVQGIPVAEEISNGSVSPKNETAPDITPLPENKFVEKRLGSIETPVNPADVRKMISDTHDKYITDMRAYVSATWPSWYSLQPLYSQALAGYMSEIRSGAYMVSLQNFATAHPEYETMQKEMLGYFTPKITAYIKDFCDLNPSVPDSDEVKYCHSVFVDPNNLYQSIIK